MTGKGKRHRMTFGSLFSGIGGMDLGLERAGMVCKWQVEIDPFCQKVLAKHWPDVKRYGDIREVNGNELESVDLIAGGFPCQDVSAIGLRRGVDAGQRSGLYREMLRLVRHLRPGIVLMENVSGLFVDGLGRVLGDLAEIGYDSEWHCLSACAFGAPHPRERVFILAYPEGKGPQTGGILRRVTPGSAECSNCRPNYLGSWPSASGIVGVADGVPNRMDRVKSLGNAVVPQVAEWIGRRILEFSHG